MNKLIPGEPALEVKNLIVEELAGDSIHLAGENKNDDRLYWWKGL
ncbi:MAG: hypothetical protein V8R91_13005 [Butyricimonas faecihominis]